MFTLPRKCCLASLQLCKAGTVGLHLKWWLIGMGKLSPKRALVQRDRWMSVRKIQRNSWECQRWSALCGSHTCGLRLRVNSRGWRIERRTCRIQERRDELAHLQHLAGVQNSLFFVDEVLLSFCEVQQVFQNYLWGCKSESSEVSRTVAGDKKVSLSYIRSVLSKITDRT